MAKRALIVLGYTTINGCSIVNAGMGIDKSKYDLSQEEFQNKRVQETEQTNQSKPKIDKDNLPNESNQSTEKQEPIANTLQGPLEDIPLIFDTEGLVDDDGVGKLTYQWQAQEPNGQWVMVNNGSSQAFTPRQAHVNKPLRARIEYLDGQGTLESIVSPATLPVQNVNDQPVGKLKLVGTATEDQTLQIDAAEISDEDGFTSLNFFWERSTDGINWNSYSSSSSDQSLLRLNQQQVGYAYRGKISYTDNFGAKETAVTPASRVVTNIDDPAIGSLIINGKPLKGSLLSVDTSNITDEDGIASISITWQISENGSDWLAATDIKDRTLTLTRHHIGQVVRAKAVVVDNFGNQAEILSSVSTPVKNVNTKPFGTIRIITAQ